MTHTRHSFQSRLHISLANIIQVYPVRCTKRNKKLLSRISLTIQSSACLRNQTVYCAMRTYQARFFFFVAFVSRLTVKQLSIHFSLFFFRFIDLISFKTHFSPYFSFTILFYGCDIFPYSFYFVFSSRKHKKTLVHLIIIPGATEE